MRSQIEINGEYLDLYDDMGYSLNYTIGDIREPEKRQSSYSKTITIPGTGNNNKIFTHVFEINKKISDSSLTTQFANDFNPNLKANVKLFIDDNLVLSGYLQLLRIINLAGKIDYEVTIYGDLGNIFSDIKDLDLTQLDLSTYDHVYSVANIVNSWDTSIQVAGAPVAFAYGTGYVYPMIDYGIIGGGYNMDDIPVYGWRPAIYVKTIVDKIFSEAGYTYTSDFFDSAFFKKLIIPHSGAALKLSSAEVNKRMFKAVESNQWFAKTPVNGSVVVGFNYISQFTSSAGGYDNNNNYDSALRGHVIKKNGREKLKFHISSHVDLYAFVTWAGTFVDPPYSLVPNAATETTTLDISVEVYKTVAGVTTATGYKHQFATQAYPLTTVVIADSSTATQQVGTEDITFDYTTPILDVAVGEVYSLGYSITTNNAITFILHDNSISYPASQVNGIQFNISENNASQSYFQNEIINTTIVEGDDVILSQYLPTMKQGEFMNNLFKMFNLYAIPTVDDYSIEPRKDFYSQTSIDWSDKIDYSKEINIIPLAELNSKSYQFTYKPDVDHYNKIYTNITSKVYGQTDIYEINNDFLQDRQKNEITFSPTPVVGNSFNNKIFPCFIDYNSAADIASTNMVYDTSKKSKELNTRILMYNGLVATSTWNIKSLLTPFTYAKTYFPFCAPFDNRGNPTVSIDFAPITGGTIDPVFYTTDTITNNTLFNTYWRDWLTSITSPDSKIITCYVHLTPVDISLLNFKLLYFIDGSYYRLNKIMDYDPISNETTLCEFFKVLEGSAFTGTTTTVLPIVTAYNFYEGGLNEVRNLGATSPYNYVEGGLDEVRDVAATSNINYVSGGTDTV